jgi:Lon protease-like protein
MIKGPKLRLKAFEPRMARMTLRKLNIIFLRDRR